MNSDSFEKLKPFKLCFNNEIHRISKLPDDYASLVQTVNLAFKDTLPSAWALQYKDADNDFVMLTNDEDFKAMLECEAESSSKSIKIFIMSLNETNSMNFSSVSKVESVEYSQILEKPKEEIPEPKVEEKIEVSETQKVEEAPKEEVPIVEEKSQVLSQPEPVVLAKNVTDSSTYLNVAFDYVPTNRTEVSTKAEIPVPEEPERGCGRRRHHHHRHHWGSHEERKLHKKEKLRAMVNELMMENMPQMVELMQQYKENPAAFKQKQAAPVKEEEVHVHYRVTCDGCGVNPIIGVCYKCSVCQDFDYCAKCEQTVEHPHPFLKIKDPKQRPRAIITVLEEELPEQQSNVQESIGESIKSAISNLSKETKEQVSKVLGNVSEKLFGESVEEMIEKAHQAIPEPVVEKEEETIHNVSFLREICTIPSKITTKDKAIYKTVSLKNNGRKEWPSECVIRNLSGAKGQDTKVVPLAPGKDFSCIIILENPNVAGEHSSTWTLAVPDSNGNLKNFGEPFTVSFNVLDVAQPKVEKVEPVVEKKEAPKKEYSQKVKDNANYIKDIFPEVDYAQVLEFVNSSPDMTVEELVENYLK